MEAFTDYPFIELGDIAGKEAPVRECTVISYDGDKYCRVDFGIFQSEIKSGYIYQKSGRLGEVPCITREQLEALPRTTYENRPRIARIGESK